LTVTEQAWVQKGNFNVSKFITIGKTYEVIDNFFIDDIGSKRPNP